MRDLNVGILPVVEAGEAIGVVTDRDLVLRVMADGRETNEVPLWQVMTSDVLWMFEDEDLDEAIDAMAERKISRLLVKSRQGALIGIVSAADVAALCTPEQVGALMNALGTAYWQKHLEAIV
jgi:CBS domain-containing protein